jgi:predicted Zn-dependent peptidase
MLLHPTLAGMEIEKRIITEEALEDINERGEETNPSNLCSKLLWPGHPLGMPTIGYLDTIRDLTEEDLRSYLADYYVPSNALVVAAGKHDPESFFAACEEHLSGWDGGPPPAAVPVNEIQEEPRSLFVKDSDSQVNLQVAFRGFARPDNRIMALRLIRRILCGGGSSRLHLALREKLGIVYSVDASLSAYEETGAFAIELATAPENLELAVSEVLREVRALALEDMHAAELDRVKEGYFYDLEYSSDSTYEMQVRYGWGELMQLVRSIDDDRAEAAAIDAAAIRETARTLFAPENINLVAVGPWKAPARRAIERLIKEYRKSWGESKDL